MNPLIKNIFRFILFILAQVYLLDGIYLHQLITPQIYFLFILWMPFHMNRSLQMVIAALLGLTLDAFHQHLGFHMAACLLIAYIRPFFIGLLIPQEGADANYDEPSPKSMGGTMPYLFYAASLTIIHHAWLFLLEAWQFGNAWYFIGKTILSSALSLVLVMIVELIFVRKQKFRTNTI